MDELHTATDEGGEILTLEHTVGEECKVDELLNERIVATTLSEHLAALLTEVSSLTTKLVALAFLLYGELVIFLALGEFLERGELILHAGNLLVR